MIDKRKMREPFARLDREECRAPLLPYCRLKYGEVWNDPLGQHKVGVLDATKSADVDMLMGGQKADLVINDPPYNVVVGGENTVNIFKTSSNDYMEFSRLWVENALRVMAEDSSFYIWLGADQNAGFQPLPEFMLLMRNYRELKSRSFITMRNQRGYGTQKNWMAIRQELLYYTKGNPFFKVIYTDIPKVLKGYYKELDGVVTENLERSKSQNIRAGNVWMDLQQVFYRMKENVPGAYVQKPLKAQERIILSGSREGALVLDMFAHSGTTLLAAEILGRSCFTMDLDPLFAELSIRRLEHYRRTGEPGWQCANPFPELEEQNG